MERKFNSLEYRIGTLKDIDKKFDDKHGHHFRLNRKLFGRKRVKEIRQSMRGLIELYQETNDNLHATDN